MQVATRLAAATYPRAARLVLATLIAAGTAILPAGTALPTDAAVPTGMAGATPSRTPVAWAAAVVRPAVVYLEVQWQGWVRDKVSGQLWDPNSVSITTRCSGFAVSNDGFMITAGHCVDPGVEGVAGSFFWEIANRYYEAGQVSQGQVQELVADMMSNAEIEGEASGEPAVRRVYVQRGVARAGLTSGEAIQARVVSLHPVSEGDIALLKIEKSNQPMVLLADTTDIKLGTDVLAVGYPAPADDVSAATVAPEQVAPSQQEGRIDNRRTEGGGPFYDTGAATSPGMSGGPVTNLDGDVMGLLSYGPAGERPVPDVLAASSVIAEELARNDVRNELGKIDNDYRSGLDDYYNGRYSAAIEKFDQVLATVPSHAQAQEYRQQALSLRGAEVKGIPTPLVVALGFGACVLVVAVTMAVTLVVVRGRRRSPPLAMAGGPMVTTGPAVGTVPNPTLLAPTVPAPTSPVRPPQAGTPTPTVAQVYCTTCGTGSPAGTAVCATCSARLDR